MTQNEQKEFDLLREELASSKAAADQIRAYLSSVVRRSTEELRLYRGLFWLLLAIATVATILDLLRASPSIRYRFPFPHRPGKLSSQANRHCSMAILYQIRVDGSQVQYWEMGSKPLVVGRGDCVDALVEDDALSRSHFLISREGSDHILIDLSSSNGTWVNGAPVSAHKLGPNRTHPRRRIAFLFLRDARHDVLHSGHPAPGAKRPCRRPPPERPGGPRHSRRLTPATQKSCLRLGTV